MRDPRDRVEIDGVEDPFAQPRADPASAPSDVRAWLGVWFKCCHVYGRMYKNGLGTGYHGNCPKCGAAVRARVGTGGTSRRMFTAE